MRDKSKQDMRSSTDSSDLDRQDQRTLRARDSSAMFPDENLIDFSNDRKQNTMESMQDNVEDSPSNDEPASEEQSFFKQVKQAAVQVIGLSQMHRYSPQKPHATNIDQQINTRSKLEEDIVAWQKTCEKLEKDNRVAASEINQLRSKLKTAEDQHEMTEALARSQAQRHQTDIKSAKACNESLRNGLDIASEEILDLRSEIATADEKFRTAEIAAAEDISQLTSDINTAKEELFEEKRTALQEIQQLQNQIEVLNEKNDKFRQMLIPVSEEQVLDVTVVRKYNKIRSSIMALVMGTWKLKLRIDMDVEDLSKDQYQALKSSSSGSYDRLRYVVFHFIWHGIFIPKNYFLKDGFERFEHHLQKVEKGLCETSPAGNDKLVMDWRKASFKVTEAFRGDGRRLSRTTQSSIWGFLRPLEIVDDAAEAKGRKKLEEVCDAAIDLSLTIRQLRDYFQVDGMERAVGQPITQWDTYAEEMAMVPATDGEQPGTIAYVIVGALTKSPKENMDITLVLVKAEVAVYH